MVSIIRSGKLTKAAVATLLATGIAVVPVGSALAEDTPHGNACRIGTIQTVDGAGAFRASSEGSGTGDAAVDSGGNETQYSNARLSWELSQRVTGPVATGTMSGSLHLTLKLPTGQQIEFESTCILEAGVFAGSTEDDPFGAEVTHTVRRGIEGEWMGKAENLPADDQNANVIASLAVWTVNGSSVPRFHLDITTAVPNGPSVCPTETDPSASAHSLAQGTRAEIEAPNLTAGRGYCAI